MGGWGGARYVVRGLGINHFLEGFDMIPMIQGDLLMILKGELEK